MAVQQGQIKLPRPTRRLRCVCHVPQGVSVVWRAEHTREYVSMTKDRERRWRAFSTFLREEEGLWQPLAN